MKTKNKSILALVMFSVMFVLNIASPVLAHAGEDDYGHHGMMGDCCENIMSGFGMGFFGWIFMILVIVALVLFIVWLIKQMQKPKRKR